MLISFSIANFRSFKSEQTLNLIVSKRLPPPEQSAHCVPIPDTSEHVLRVASLYGANAAGKSNLVQALGLLKRLVLRGTSPGQLISYKPFLLDSETPKKPTSFELQFLEEGEVFRYGVCYDANRVHEEWLDVYEGKKERNLFSRITRDDGAVTVELAAAKRGEFSRKMKALADVGARPNQLFLTEVVNLDDRDAQGPFFQRVIQWFASTLTVIRADAQFVPLAETIAIDEQFASFAERFLREASTGIDGLEVETNRIAKLAAPYEEFEQLMQDLPDRGTLVVQGPQGEEIVLSRSEDDAITVRKLAVLHEDASGQRTKFPLNEESDGSRRLLNLLPALHKVAGKGGVFVIDELERSMHPILARKFVQFFLSAVRGAKSQLVFTTHESTLLDLALQRRDGIWFAEKDERGATHLYSLADFKVRKDLRIEKGYLEGRFGAVPFLGGIDHLMEEQACAEAKG
jgi:AAA15 family ATPase/GTPase